MQLVNDMVRDDCFEGSYEEHKIFKEVFFGSDIENTTKRCLVTGVINFESDSSKNVDSSLSSINSAVISGGGCLCLEYDPSTSKDGSDSNTKKAKRAKISDNNSDFARDTIPLHIVETSNNGVSTSSYLLKQRIEKGKEVYLNGIVSEKFKSQSEGKELIAISSPVSQESSATRMISPVSTLPHRENKASKLSYNELKMSEICLKIDPKEDPRPLLYKFISKLLTSARWKIEKFQRGSMKYAETIYVSTEGRRYREFRSAWRSLGKFLLADYKLTETGIKKWTGINDFWSDLSLTLLDIEENMNMLNLANTRAIWWSTLEPFVTAVFVEKRVGSLRKGDKVEVAINSVIDKFKKDDLNCPESVLTVSESSLLVCDEIVMRKKLQRRSQKISEIKPDPLDCNSPCSVECQDERLRNDKMNSSCGNTKKGSKRARKNGNKDNDRNRSSQKKKAQKSKARTKQRNSKGGCRLLPRSMSNEEEQLCEENWSTSGPRTVLSWLIATKVISKDEVIELRDPDDDDTVVKTGLVTNDGVVCKCCDKIISLSEFKNHAGFNQNCPCLNLFVGSGKLFVSCQLEAWYVEYKARRNGKRLEEATDDDPNDDSCGICGDGGELICCDNCPSTFHQACLEMKVLPEGNWYCSNCTCWICGELVRDNAPAESSHDLKCSQCAHKYHGACLQKISKRREPSPATYFCGKNCEKVHNGLSSRVGIVNTSTDGLSWTILKCFKEDGKVCSARSLALKAECNSKLVVALSIMEESFQSMVDARTGIDMIPHVIYNWGSSFARLDFDGFYTVVVEKNDVMISVASIRVHGVSVAEMPLVATCSKYRRQGVCRVLLTAIEEMLMSLKVEKFVVAALPSLVETWTDGFGFKPMDDEELDALKRINLMVFPGTVLLKKELYECTKGKDWDNSLKKEAEIDKAGFAMTTELESCDQMVPDGLDNELSPVPLGTKLVKPTSVTEDIILDSNAAAVMGEEATTRVSSCVVLEEEERQVSYVRVVNNVSDEYEMLLCVDEQLDSDSSPDSE